MPKAFDNFRQKIGKIVTGGKDVLGGDIAQSDPILQIVPSGTSFGVRPSVLHAKLYYYYIVDPGIQNAVNTFVDQIFGSDYYLTADDPASLKLVEAWFKTIKFKNKLKVFITDALITGNAMFQKLYQSSSGKLMDLDLVDMRIVVRIDPMKDDVETPQTIVQRIGGKEDTIDYDRVVHWKLFEISKMFLGIGLFHSLAVPQYVQDGEPRSILDDMQSMREAFPRIVKRYASPKTSFVYENENEAYIKKRALEWKGMKDGEAMFSNKNFAFQEFKIDGNSRFEKYLDLINLWYETGTQTPATKLQTTPGFTEASSKSALDLLERRINGRKTTLINIIEEEIINVFLSSWGKTDQQIEKANIEFHFGLPETPEFDLNQVLDAVNTVVATEDGPKRLIQWEEFRDMAGKSGWILVPNDEVESVPEDVPTIERPKGGIHPEDPQTPPPSGTEDPAAQVPDTPPEDPKKPTKNNYIVKKVGDEYHITETSKATRTRKSN